MLREDYKDALFEGDRKYNLKNNSDGTVSLTDATQYTQEGDAFAARDVNATNQAVNKLAAIRDVTLPASGWSTSAPYTQTIQVEGVVETDRPFIGPNIGNITADQEKAITKNWGKVSRAVSGNGQITFYCFAKKPDVDLPLVVKG